MSYEWSLDVLYKGLDDENYKNDLKKLEQLVNDIKAFSQNLKEGEDEEEQLLAAIDYLEQLEILSGFLKNYLELRQSVNTTDGKIVSELGNLEKMLSETSRPIAAIKKWIANVKSIENYKQKHPKIKSYSFFIDEIKKEAKHLLSDDVEDVIAKLNISAGAAWSSMQSYLTSIVEVDYRGEKVTLSQIRNLAYDKDPSVRKDAYEAELKAYEKIKDAISYSLY